MLIGIDPLLTADLLHALAAMGHGDTIAAPPVFDEMNRALADHGHKSAATAERQAFYAAAERAYVIVRTGERRFYGNILLTKGVLPPEST